MLAQRTADVDQPLSYWARIIEKQVNEIKNVTIPDYPQDESMATVTAREYRQELQERAAEGDKYAASMLKGEPNDEPIS